MNLSSNLQILLDKGGILLTPTRRLATAYLAGYEKIKAENQELVWETPKIFSAQDWVNQIWDILSSQHQHLPHRIDILQSLFIFEDIIKTSEYAHIILRHHSTAKIVQSGWNILNQWQKESILNDEFYEYDQKAFQNICITYQETLKSLNKIDPSQLLNVLVQQLENENLPKILNCTTQQIYCSGFDDITPQFECFLDYLKSKGWQIEQEHITETSNSNVHRVLVKDVQDEMEYAASWALMAVNQHKNNPDFKVGIVLPNLPNYRNQILECFKKISDPFYILNPEEKIHSLFNISAAIPLYQYPIIHTASMILNLLKPKIKMDDLIHLLQSPFIKGGMQEYDIYQELSSKLNSFPKSQFTLSDLLVWLQKEFSHNLDLFEILHSFEEFKSKLQAKNKHSVWQEVFQRALTLLSWPGERTLNSIEHQAVKRFFASLREFAQLDEFFEVIPLLEALEQFKKLLSNIPFQPENKKAPIQILGILEASGLSYDALWVMNLCHENWPAPAEPNPFIPLSIQRQYNMPHASAERELQFAHTLTQKLTKSAPTVILSSPKFLEDRLVYESELISSWPKVEVEALSLVNSPQQPEEITHELLTENLEDQIGPTIEQGSQIKGGSQILKDQALCPFKAFAKFRLNAINSQTETIGLNPQTRGILVHDILQIIWQKLKTHSNLMALAQEQNSLVEETVNNVIKKHSKNYDYAEQFWSIEQKRLTKIINECLDVEKQRKAFKVVAIEEQRQIELGGLKFTVRLDRVDEVKSKEYLIIDYKTGQMSLSSILDNPISDPQLPLYLLGNYTTQPKALAWFMVHAEQCQYLGLTSSDEFGIENLKSIEKIQSSLTWEQQLENWNEALSQTAAEFRLGHAEVEPKKGPQTCRYCDLSSLCRINDRVNI